MNTEKYVGLDVHKATTVAVVLNAKGELETQAVIQTKAEPVRDFVRGLSGRVEVTLEEGAQAAWLYEVLKPVAARVVVCNPRANVTSGKRNKSDEIDAARLARMLRMGELTPVWHEGEGTRTLKHLGRNYAMLVEDCTRSKNRIKAIFGSVGIGCAGNGVYQEGRREEWLGKLSDAGLRARAETQMRQLTALKELRREAKAAMTKEGRRHEAWEWIGTVPGMGAVRTAQVIGIVGTPGRFRGKRQLWAYAGLGVVRRTSAEYTIENGQVRRSKRAGATRGLNTNGNRTLKEVFKGAANTALRREPMASEYQGMVERGMRPELARVTLARKIAAVVLAVWKNKEGFEKEKLHKRPE